MLPLVGSLKLPWSFKQPLIGAPKLAENKLRKMKKKKKKIELLLLLQVIGIDDFGSSSTAGEIYAYALNFNLQVMVLFKCQY